MYAQFRYLDGPRAGDTRVLGKDFATLGRDPTSDIAFDPEADLEVSGRHAAVFKQGGEFLIRDLGSTNGTYLNGQRVRGDRALENGDLVQLGPTGPRIEFSTTATITQALRAEPVPAVRGRPEIFGPRARNTERVGVQQAPRVTLPWRWIGLGAVAVVAVVALMAWQARAGAQEIARRRAALRDRIDALTIDPARVPPALTASLASLGAEVAALRAQAADDSTASERIDSLTTHADRLARRRAVLLAAAGLDTVAAGASRRAVAVIIADFADGRTRSGTGVIVGVTRDTLRIATAAGLVTDSAGRAAVRLFTILDGTPLAVRTAAVPGDSGAVRRLIAIRPGGGPAGPARAGADPGPGQALLLVGYPFGVDSVGDWRRRGVAARTAVATVERVGATAVDLDGYGSRASLGTAVFNDRGELVGVVTDLSRGIAATRIR